MGVIFDPILGKIRSDSAGTISGSISADQVIYNGASPAQFAVGDSPVGASLVGRSIQDITQEERVGYADPSFSAFAISGLTTSQVREMGNSYTRGPNVTFTRTTTSPGNVELNSIDIDDITNAVNIATGLADDGSEASTITTVILDPGLPSTVTHQYRITGTNTMLVDFIRNYTVSSQFVYPIFEGLVTNIADIFDGMTRANMLALPMSLAVVPEQNRIVNTSPTAQRFAFAYPASYGNLTSIIDNNGFETISDYTIVNFNLSSMLNGATVAYRAYILTGATTNVNFNNTYKF